MGSEMCIRDRRSHNQDSCFGNCYRHRWRHLLGLKLHLCLRGDRYVEAYGDCNMVNDHKFGKTGQTVFVAKGGAVWARKEGQNPKGGLNQKGRDAYNRQTGGDLKPPVSAKQAAKSPKAAGRRDSFCARMSGMPGPMKDDKGKPTRKALALNKWDC